MFLIVTFGIVNHMNWEHGIGSSHKLIQAEKEKPAVDKGLTSACSLTLPSDRPFWSLSDAFGMSE